MLHYEDWGSDKTYPHMAVGWAWAFDTPFKWTKQVASHFGGTRQGMAISWPGHIKDVGGIRTQFHHVIDIVPTILEATGIQAPATGQRHHAKAHRRREHGLHVRPGECQCALEARHAVFRDGRQPRDLPRRLDGRHDAARPALGHGNGQDARCRQRLQVGTLQHRRRLFAIQRPRRKDAGQAQGNAGVVPDGGGEIQRLPLG